MQLKKILIKDGKTITEINFDFEKITGNDIVSAEKESRMLGDNTPDVCYSKTFQAIIAAKAADCKLIVDDVMGLSGGDFINATTQAGNFLFGWALPGARGNN